MKTIIHELDAVALMTDVPEHELERDDLGSVVLVHGNSLAFEVEFVGYDGATLALLTLTADQVRPSTSQDIPHVRSLTPA